VLAGFLHSSKLGTALQARDEISEIEAEAVSTMLSACASFDGNAMTTPVHTLAQLQVGLLLSLPCFGGVTRPGVRSCCSYGRKRHGHLYWIFHRPKGAALLTCEL
jgi:hypothetical protein